MHPKKEKQIQPMKAIIVGATSGIGLEVAKVLAAKGWQVGIAGRRQDLLSSIVESEPNIIAAQCIDITQQDAADKLQQLIDQMGGMDLYFHSSGIGYQNPELDTEMELRTVMTNTIGFTRMIDYVFHYFMLHPEQSAHIAVISSIAGTKGLGAAPAYSSSKRYINHYMECLTQLCAIRSITHIHLHDIRPGFVRTALLRSGGHYPMQLEPTDVAQEIVRGIERNKSIITVDWKYRILVAVWRLIPRFVWVRLKISSKKQTKN